MHRVVAQPQSPGQDCSLPPELPLEAPQPALPPRLAAWVRVQKSSPELSPERSSPKLPHAASKPACCLRPAPCHSCRLAPDPRLHWLSEASCRPCRCVPP